MSITLFTQTFSRTLAWAFIFVTTTISLAVVIVVCGISGGWAMMRVQHSPAVYSPVNTQPAATAEDQALAGWQTYQDKADGFLVRYPPDWIAETNQDETFFYSPESYRVRAAGSYSLHIHLHSNYSTIDDYLKSRVNCVQNITRHDFTDFSEFRYADVCYSGKPEIFVRPYQQEIIEGIHQFGLDESGTIDDILATFQWVVPPNTAG